MKNHIITTTKKEPESFEECTNTDCKECIFEFEFCGTRRKNWVNGD